MPNKALVAFTIYLLAFLDQCNEIVVWLLYGMTPWDIYSFFILVNECTSDIFPSMTGLGRLKIFLQKYHCVCFQPCSQAIKDS